MSEPLQDTISKMRECGKDFEGMDKWFNKMVSDMEKERVDCEDVNAQEVVTKMGEYEEKQFKIDYRFTTNIGDLVVYKNESNPELTGYVKLVNIKGVNVSTPYGDKFVKWANVISVDKNNRAVWTNNTNGGIELNLLVKLYSEFKSNHYSLELKNKLFDKADLYDLIEDSTEITATLGNGDKYTLK